MSLISFIEKECHGLKIKVIVRIVTTDRLKIWHGNALFLCMSPFCVLWPWCWGGGWRPLCNMHWVWSHPDEIQSRCEEMNGNCRIQFRPEESLLSSQLTRKENNNYLTKTRWIPSIIITLIFGHCGGMLSIETSTRSLIGLIRMSCPYLKR